MKIEGLIVEIFEDNVSVQSRTIPPKGDRGQMTLYSQIAFAYLGGRFPVEFSLSLKEGDSPYPAGKYIFHSQSFSVGQFNRIEFSREPLLIPYKAS